MESVSFHGSHTGSILCAYAFANNTAISAGENGEACLWSSDGKALQTLCLDAKQDILSVVGYKSDTNSMLLAFGSGISKYDLRQFVKPVENIAVDCDEINQIVLSDDEKYLAIADDSGYVIMYNLTEKKITRTLRKHTNMCSSIAFRPGKANELYSVSYDQRLIHWDFHRVRALSIIEMDKLDSDTNSVSKYLINPPFIHTLSVSPEGNFVACGTENAKIHVFNGRRRNVEFVRTLSGHRLGVSQVHFPQQDKNGLLISGGNDGQLLLWRLPGTSGKKTDDEEVIVPWYTVNHGNKINWITSTGGGEHSLSIFVCDNTAAMTKYCTGNM